MVQLFRGVALLRYFAQIYGKNPSDREIHSEKPESKREPNAAFAAFPFGCP